VNMPFDTQPSGITPQADIVPQPSTEEKDHPTSTPTGHASPPKVADSALARKEIADISTQTDTALEQSASVTPTLQPLDAAPTSQTPTAATTLQNSNQAVPTRERIPLSRTFEPQRQADRTNNDCQVCILTTLGAVSFVVLFFCADIL